MGDEGVGLLQDRELRYPGLHVDVVRDGAQLVPVGVPADLEYDVPAGQVAVRGQAPAVELGPIGVRRAQRDQQHALRVRGAGPALLGSAPAEAGADERHRAGVDVLAVRLHRPGDQGEGVRGAPGEGVHVRGGRAAAGEPPGELRAVRVGAGQGPQLRRHVLFVALPGDDGR